MIAFFLIAIIFIIFLASIPKRKPKVHIPPNDFWNDFWADKTNNKIVLCVPPDERNEAKRLGARYDKEYKALTITYSMKRKNFERWIDEDSFR